MTKPPVGNVPTDTAQSVPDARPPDAKVSPAAETAAEAQTATGRWPRGSEWRKWDVHVHRPASHGFAGDWNQFVIQVGNADCDVVGINDYFSVAGYKEIRRRLQDPPDVGGNKAYREAIEKLKVKTLLPVVECRMTNVVIGKKMTQGAQSRRVNRGPILTRYNNRTGRPRAELVDHAVRNQLDRQQKSAGTMVRSSKYPSTRAKSGIGSIGDSA